MSNREVTNWNLRHQQRQVLDQSNERNKSCHSNIANNHHFQEHENFTQLAPMSNFEVAELTWENGQLALNELGGIFPPPTSTTAKPTWGGTGRVCDTLESIVHQATHCNQQGPNLICQVHNRENVGSVVASCGGKLAENSGPVKTPSLPPPSGLVKKRTRSEQDHSRRNNLATNDHESACASANPAVSKDNNDTTMMTWTSFDSSRTCNRTKITSHNEDSACLGGSENHDEERDTKGETGSSHIPRRGRAAAVHNQSERRRRDRINQKMKALQKLVPNASKTDKASMLDEVIEYLKQLQAQVQMMSNTRLMPQFMMPFGMQQLQQMSLLARMGMGMGIGILDPTSNCQTPTPSHSISQLIHPNPVATPNSGYVPSSFASPQMFSTTQQPNLDIGAGTSSTLQDPYSALLAQSMNLDLFNRITALQRQQQAQAQQISNQMQSNSQMQADKNSLS